MIVIRLVLTLLFVIGAVSGGVLVWHGVFEDPWTRDAHVRADIVEISPQISGPVLDVFVANNGHVEKGEPILTIEATDYRQNVAEAEANLAQAAATADLKEQDARRYAALRDRASSAVSDRDVVTAQLEARAAKAAAESAQVVLTRARTNLERTTIHAPVSGSVANLSADPGDYATAGKPLLAIVDEGSFRVDAFFMETSLPSIRTGSVARVKLMSSGETLVGEVAGISAGISYGQDGSDQLLQNPVASFEWIRLAQRVPVEISLKENPKLVPLVNGATATVVVQPPDGTGRTGIGRMLRGLWP
jgi:multidrug resistance efflux pump